MTTPETDTPQAETPKINFLDAIKFARFIPQVIQIVAGIQALMGPGDGTKKKAEAVKLVASVLAVVEGVAEKDLVNDAEFLAFADEAIEFAVSLMQLQPRVDAIAQRIRAIRPSNTTRSE